LPTHEARDKEPLDGFRRAIKDMSKNRLIRRVEEGNTGDSVRFQFTQEFKEDDGLGYSREAVITLNTKTGVVECRENPGMAKYAMECLKNGMEVRTGTDIVNIGHRILMKNDVDLFPIRWKGGAYFVAARSLEWVDKVERFFNMLGCVMYRWPIAKGTARGDKSIAETVSDGLSEQVNELMRSIGKLSADSRPKSFENLAIHIKDQRFKTMCYADLLGSLRDEALEYLDKADMELHRIVSVIGAGGDPQEGRVTEDSEETVDEESLEEVEA
jgi:hypothetical protein